ncbi:hypothetical protein [Haloarcula pellucida]|uniref:Uncharacterized protein n=1 Tax=Haloarcula pellucida TaxID=1427151 RepID=A0A830GTZ8_9EURY|nr:hypothetical protein [Halomicroarcula pellucida]MBX0349615.1 hypothetical protein [Halomicroarcula pellucida]GGO02103.1 hypothetical protein GCM10009030_36280 [Halomicroarcula pellucida]
MLRQFHRAKPLQAAKLTAIVLTLLYSTGVYLRIVPSERITTLFLVPLMALALALTVVGEALYAGYRAARTDGHLTATLTADLGYTIVRAVELGTAVAAVAGVAAVVASIPAGPMSGPGAIGLFLVLVGLGVLVLLAGLLRSLAELYRHRQGARSDERRPGSFS